MKFCSVCDNMYYISINEHDGNALSYYCRNCGHKDNTILEEGVCVLNTKLQKSEQQFSHMINEYTKLDPTLPRVTNIPCPNTNCATNAESSADGKKPQCEVLYIRFDDRNMKYLYICTACDTVWKTNDIR
jgi:DNA-directed RNA polymerase subunit M/transcription elongation factor TFIIS